MLLDSTTREEIENEITYLCEDLQIMARFTDQLFKAPQVFRCNPCECGSICPDCNPDEFEYLRTETKREREGES